MKIIIFYQRLIFVILMLMLLLGLSFKVRADTINPCEYMNLNATAMNKLDTGNDENFERIKQQNNRDMIIACQQYEIKQLREKTNTY